MAFSLTEAQSFYSSAKTAYERALEAYKYSINTGGSSRSIERQKLDTLKNEMLYWQKEVTAIEAGTSGMSVKFGTSNS